MTHYLPDLSRVEAIPLHGVFSRDRSPALTVGCGDEVVLSTLDAWWGLGDGDATRAGVHRHPECRLGHALTGPIAVEGVGPGDLLTVRLLELVPSDVGFTECGGLDTPHYRPLGCHLPPYARLTWTLDGRHARTRLAGGVDVAVPVSPFLGVIGLPPAAPGWHSTTPPRPTGGNLDCRWVTAGATILLPVEVAGGLLSIGDGHAAQGDGEVSNNGIECAMGRVRLRLGRIPAEVSGIPRTPTIVHENRLIVLGFGDHLDAAARDATSALLDLLTSALGCSRPEALGLASVAADLSVTQIVNGVVGVHATLRRERFASPSFWDAVDGWIRRSGI